MIWRRFTRNTSYFDQRMHSLFQEGFIMTKCLFIYMQPLHMIARDMFHTTLMEFDFIYYLPTDIYNEISTPIHMVIYFSLHLYL